MFFREWSGGSAAAFLAIAGCCFAATLSPAQTAGTQDAEAPSGVQILSADRMSPQDAALLAERRPDVERAAELYGYEISAATWVHSQVQCPVLSDDLLVRFRQSRPKGANSLFTAIVPRARNPVRVVPLIYNGVEANGVFEDSPAVRGLIDKMTADALKSNAPDAAGATQVGRWNDVAECLAAVAGADSASAGAAFHSGPIIEFSASSDPHKMSVRRMTFTASGPDIRGQAFEILFDGRAHVKSITASPRPSPVLVTAKVSREKWHTIPAPNSTPGKSGTVPAQQPSPDKSRTIPGPQ